VATFSAQVVDLVGTFSDETALDSFITEEANEVINAMPRSMQERVAEETSFTNTTTSEGSKVLHVLRNDGTIDQPCRRIPARHRGRIQDSSDMQYATATDPAYYIQDAAVTIFPTGTGKLVSIPTYNQGSALDASSLSTITNFPNEAEYLVTLYAAIKALQQNMSGKLGNSDITTALTAINTELDETQAVCDKINADLVLAKAEVVLAKAEAAEIASNTDNSSDFETACDAMVTELNKVDGIIVEASGEFDKVDNVIVEGSTEFDEAKNLSGAYNSGDIRTALDAIQGAVDEVDNIVDVAKGKVTDFYTSIGDIDDGTELWDNTNKRFTVVRDALVYAGSLIDGNKPDAAYDVAQNLLDVNAALDGMQAHLADGEAILTSDPTSGDIATALTAMKNAIEAAEASFDKMEASTESVFGDEDTFTTANSQLTRVKDALDKVSSLIEANKPASGYDAHDLLQAEDIELLQGNLSIVGVELQRAQMHLSEWTSIGDMRVKEINASLAEAQAYGSEIQARLAYASAYQQASAARGQEGQSRIAQTNVTLAAAQQELARANAGMAEINTIMNSYKLELEGVAPYLQSAQQYANQASGYVQEIQAYSNANQIYLNNGNAYLQEANAIVSQGNAYLKEAQSYIAQANGYAAEVNARSSFVNAKSQAVNGHISTAQSYVATAQGFSGEIQSKIGIAQAYGNEVQSRLAVDTTEYSWYEKQQAKLQADYDRGIQLLAKG